MPPYYDAGRLRRKIDREKKRVEKAQRRLSEEVRVRTRPPANKLCVDVGVRIRAFRLAAGLTQLKLAGIINTSRTAIIRIEAGRQNLSLKNLEKIGKAFGRKIEVMFK